MRRHAKRAKEEEPEEVNTASSAPPTPFEKFEEFARQVLSVSKAEIDERERVYQERRKRKQVQAQPE